MNKCISKILVSLQLKGSNKKAFGCKFIPRLPLHSCLFANHLFFPSLPLHCKTSSHPSRPSRPSCTMSCEFFLFHCTIVYKPKNCQCNAISLTQMIFYIYKKNLTLPSFEDFRKHVFQQ